MTLLPDYARLESEYRHVAVGKWETRRVFQCRPTAVFSIVISPRAMAAASTVWFALAISPRVRTDKTSPCFRQTWKNTGRVAVKSVNAFAIWANHHGCASGNPR